LELIVELEKREPVMVPVLWMIPSMSFARNGLR